MARALIALCSAALVAASAAARPLDEATVTPPTGPITGVVTPTARFFKGIPYAKPPVGALRWNPPQPADAWSEPLAALKDGAGCPQDCKLPPMTCPPVMSEDCLTLNVFTPRTAHIPAAGLPVMVWFHGGNFKQGYSGGVLYTGLSLSNRTDVLLVTANYRLGVLGFLNTGDTIKGNYGIQDQRRALEWVRDNIKAFGGDASRVTIFGQSAGAMSVATHIASPLSKGLFHGAILESEPFSLPFRTQSNFEGWSSTYAEKFAKCNASLPGGHDACLRRADWSQIVVWQAMAEKDLLDQLNDILHVFLPWTPTVGSPDGELAKQPQRLWEEGAINDVPIVVGTVSNEGVEFVYEAFGTPMPTSEMDLMLGVVFGSKLGKAVQQQYPVPAGSANDTRMLFSKIATDALFICPTRNVSLAKAARASDTYVYHFKHVMSFGAKVWGPDMWYCFNKVCHAEELPFVFHPDEAQFKGLNISLTTAEVALANAVQDYWGQFATSLAPGSAPAGPGAKAMLQWPKFAGAAAAAETTMTLDTPNSLQEAEFDQMCAFWDATGYPWLEGP